jgi:hypothetical protein
MRRTLPGRSPAGKPFRLPDGGLAANPSTRHDRADFAA